jgi:hypothetical protein
MFVRLSCLAVDVRELREERRLVGALIGCLPRRPLQNVCGALPLELGVEELSVLVHTGL